MRQSNSEFRVENEKSDVGIFTISTFPDLANIQALSANPDQLVGLLHTKGAILLRGFQIDSTEKFKTVAQLFTDNLMSDNGEHNPLPESSGVYTPVVYSAKEKLLWHNENSFNHTWPLIIMFAAAVPAQSGGETPVVDSRKVLHGLDPNVLEEFKSKGILYKRTHGFGFGRSWQETYRTDDRNYLESLFDKQNIEFEWCGGDQLITRQIRPAVVKHPVTQELSWFNQAQHWHPYCLQPQVRQSLLRIFGEEQLPRSCHFGDGSKISDDIMQHVLSVYEKFEIVFPWQQGDMMILDNVLFAHARNPYCGERKLFVTMGKQAAFLEATSSYLV